MGNFLARAWYTVLTDAMKTVINPILIIAATAGIIYAVWVGIKFVRAEDKSARDEAKQKLIYVIIGIVATIVLIVLFYWLAANIGDGRVIDPKSWGGNTEAFINWKF